MNELLVSWMVQLNHPNIAVLKSKIQLNR